MEIIDLKEPNVLIIKNFLNKEEIESVLNSLKLVTEEQWHILSVDEDDPWYGMSLGLSNRPEIQNRYPSINKEFFIEKEEIIKKIIEKKFNEPIIHQLSGINRWRRGRDQQPHIDYFDSSEEHNFEELQKYNLSKKNLIKFEKKRFNDKHFSSLVYFNDNYSGGELYMPQWGWEIKPEPGMLICFKGDENHLHGVKMIEDGVRYTWSMFWSKLSWFLENKKEMLDNANI